MTLHWKQLKALQEMQADFLTMKARVLSLRTLKQLKERPQSLRYIKPRNFCYLSCRACHRKVEKDYGGKMKCSFCGEYTFTDLYRLKFDVLVVDDKGTATLALGNKACKQLIGVSADNVVDLHVDSAVNIPNDIERNILGKNGLFEEVVKSDNTNLDFFDVSRLTTDEQIMEVYMDKYSHNYDSDSKDQAFVLSKKKINVLMNAKKNQANEDKGKAVCEKKEEEQTNI
ncbi:hypothetical protein CASFOL_007618 [Castilleja foliolosa]|uniref:Replication factor A C-terminal domain-containing protein n=1 Tax=Castilleja foliolosa TaxID=1961234 RepID=A0ABD3E240_9LAMI